MTEILCLSNIYATVLLNRGRKLTYVTKVVHAAGKPMKHAAGKPMKHATGKPMKHAAGKPMKHVTGKPMKHAAGKPMKHAAGKPMKHAAGKPMKHNVSISTWTFLLIYTQVLHFKEFTADNLKKSAFIFIVL